MERIRYKYKNSKEGVRLEDIRCPICKSKYINWIKNVGNTTWNGNVELLAQCWSGDIYLEKPRHLFLITLKNLPEVKVEKIKDKK